MLSTNGKLAQKTETVLDSDMRFTGYSSLLMHRIHGFAAKFPPGLPRYFITEFTLPGDVVLDPMVGSGTTLVEAMLLNRRCIGVDIDPLSILQSKVKTTILNDKELEKYGKKIAVEASLSIMEKGRITKEKLDEFLREYSCESSKFFSYWFTPATIAEISILVSKINNVDPGAVKDALRVALSSIIVSKSAGVSLAIDLTHTRPHKAKNKRVLPSIPLFEKAVANIAKAAKELNQQTKDSQFQPSIIRSDSRILPVSSNSAKLVVTSPPYATALDYMRAHKFSLVWLGYDMAYLSQLRSKYIGADAGGTSFSTGLKAVDDSIVRIGSVSPQKGRAVARYFSEMQLVIQEIHRVIQPGGHAVIVVGPSIAKGTKIMTHEALIEAAVNVGLEHIGTKRRKIEQNGRQLPISNNSSRQGIEARMHEEYVLLFNKS